MHSLDEIGFFGSVLLKVCGTLDLGPSALREHSDLECGPSRSLLLVKVKCVDFVKSIILREVRHKAVALKNIFHSSTSGRKDGLDVFHQLLSLGVDATLDERAGLGVETDLASGVDNSLAIFIRHHNSLGVRAEGSRRIRRGDHRLRQLGGGECSSGKNIFHL